MSRTALVILALTVSPVTASAADPVEFRRDVIAALSRAGCNQGACHGSPQGKNGFRLSLRGGDPDLDFLTLTKEQGGRRVNRQTPYDSLILLKGSGRVLHQGGAVFGRNDPAYRMIARWVAEGCRDEKPAALARLEVIPGAGRLDEPERQLAVRAHFADGSVRDVTDLTVFSSSDPDAPVTPGGLVRFARTADAAVLVRYLDGITSARLVYIKPDTAFTFRGPRPANYIDELVFAKQKELQLLPAAVCSDEVFLRRVYLDVIGTLPTAEEASAFLDSKEPDKRTKLVDQLLGRDEYALFWALKWADILRGSPTTISDRGVHSFHRYLVRMVAEDRPVTAFARDLLTGSGNTLNKPAANFFRVARTPEEAAEAAAQLFMGVRMQCAKCHNHPFEGITQTDYYGLAAYFAQVQYKGTQFGLDDEIVYLAPGREVQNPLTRKPQPPVAFGAPAPRSTPDDDRRRAFADWLTSPANKFFAPSVVNRIWYHLLGKGIVDPVDDFRDTNPPSNPELLKALADEFARGGYRLKPLIRTILNSRTYQLAGDGPAQSPQAANPDRYFTKAMVRMLSAEQALDAVSLATGVPETFKGFPTGTRAVDLPEGGIDHPFLQAFSRPVRDVTCECAREDDPSLPQVLHMLNNAGVLAKVRSPKGHVAGWLKDGKSPEWIVEQVYLATLSRRPTARERDLVAKHLATVGDKTAGLQDVQHALLNLNEFLLRH
ncbi:MAG: hypothetical protein JWO38_6249 [Gemmataceae bacterium]|nr:hypothetical protein [Gemmataceae bacterium]